MLPEDCLDLGENKDHCDAWSWNVAGGGDAGGDGGRAMFAHSIASTYSYAGTGGDGGSSWYELMVNRGHARMSSLSSERPIRFWGSHSKMRRKMSVSSGASGRIEPRKLGSFRNARKVESSGDAFFHGLRPQVKFTRMTPRLHTSLGADA